MNDDRVIPTNGQASAVTCTLLVDGNEVAPTVEVLSIVTEREANRIPFARLCFRDGDAAAEDFPLSNGTDFAPGKELEIRAGYATDETTIFKGLIIKHGIKVRARGSSALVVECRDAAVKMTVGRKSRYFIDKTDSEVMEQLIGENGLNADVVRTEVAHPDTVQYHVSDWDYLISRADANGLLVIAMDGTVSVQPPRLDGTADLAIRFGDTVYELDADIDARRQYRSVRAYAWDYSAQDLHQEDGSAPSSTSAQGNLTESDLSAVIGLEELALRHTGRLNSQEMKAWADAHLLRSSLSKIVGRARIRGYASVRPGQLIEVNGVGERFSGTAFVAAIRHEIVRGAWYTDVQFGLPPDWFARRTDIMEVAAAGLVPAVHGLHIGVATKLEGDPDGEDRIQVRLPLVDPRANGIWARWACPDAGSDRGVFFRPEIGDELIVGFLDQDPRDPVVLGMVHSSQHAAPIPLSDDNHEKAIVTRSGMRLHFDDDKRVITVETPGGNRAVLSDDEQAIKLEDQHGNSVTLDRDGITLDGSKITLKAQQGVAIEAGTDLKAESGTNTEIKAGTQLKIEGTAGANFETSAIATIKGSLVKIN
jgi:Rhs element Vgr protein